MECHNAVFQTLWPVVRMAGQIYRTIFLRNTKTIVVIGSLGKTTTNRALRKLLNIPFPEGCQRNFRSQVVKNLFSTVPNAKYATIEVGIDGPRQMPAYASLLRPLITVVTKIAHEHTRSLGTLERIREEKAEMVRCLPENGYAILNGDDPNVLWMASQTKAKILTFGHNSWSSVRASELQLEWPHGMTFNLHIGEETHQIRTHLIGHHMVYPYLAAATTGTALGINPTQIIRLLEGLRPVYGRMQLVHLPSGTILLRDDFKSTIESVETALDTLANIPSREKIIILGELSEFPGKQGPVYRRIGRRIGEIADRVIHVGGNSQRYRSGAVSSGLSPEMFVHAGRSLTTAAEAIGKTGPGTVILVKGRFSQKLERISLALSGRVVGCIIKTCQIRSTPCDACPMLEHGWNIGKSDKRNEKHGN